LKLFKGFFIVLFAILSCSSLLLSCSSGTQKNSTIVDSAKSITSTDTIAQEDGIDLAKLRKEFISEYDRPILLDTFIVNKGEKLEVILHHYCTMDKGLTVPAQYNFDTNKDFVTHNFASDLTVLSNKDTLFKKHISKSTFNSLLDTLETPLKKYATLFYPSVSIEHDSLQVDYSISIPITDVGIDVHIRFDKKGDYNIGQ
jgi:hypothetical protein